VRFIGARRSCRPTRSSPARSSGARRTARTNRSDQLDLDPAFKVNLTYSPGGEIARTPIADAPQAIVAQARDTPELGTAGRLLE